MATENSRTTHGDTESELSFDSTGKKKSFRRLITRFAEKTSMQGPPYINMAKFWWAKVIWATLLLGAVAVMILHLWYLFDQWYSWPKTTMISLGFDDLAFPQVTICNTNVLHRRRFRKFNGAAELKLLVDDLKPENFVPHQFDDNYDPSTHGNGQNSGNQHDGTQIAGNQQDRTQTGGNQQDGTQPGGNQQDGSQTGGNQQDGTQPGENQQGGTQPGENQQGGTQPGENQQGGTQPGENQQGGTQQGGHKPGGIEHGDNQQDGATHGQQQDGTKEPPDTGTGQDSPPPTNGGPVTEQTQTPQPPTNGGPVTEKTQRPQTPTRGGPVTDQTQRPQTPTKRGPATDPTQTSPNGQGVTHSQSVGSTRPRGPRPGKTKSRPHSGTTLPGSQSHSENTEQTPQSPPSGEENAGPNSRKKRFDSNYDSLNVSKYYKNYKNYEEESRGQSELETPMDSQREIENVFRELYMNINKDNRMQLGHQISDMLVGCTFNGRKCPVDMFKLHQTAEYGNCWTISSDKYIVRRAGPGGGLTVILFLETSEYLRGLTTGYGARLQFQERDTYPFPFDEGVYISGAMETDIGLKFRTITRLGGDYGTCDDGVEFRRLYNLTYTRRACQAFCRITSVIKICKCFDDHWEEFAFKKDDTLRPCRSEKEQMCKWDIFQQFHNGDLSCRCDNPCSEVDYVKSVSARQWPSNEYARVLLDWLCNKDPDTCRSLRKDIHNIWAIKNNFLKLNIYYEDLNFENVTETAQIEIQQFLSDIGGAFGLWIGLSILSLCEVIQLFIELFDYGVHKTVRGQQADTDRKDEDIKESPGVSENSEKYTEGKLPRIVFDPRDRFPRHMRDESPYTERDRFSHTSEGGSDDSLNKRKRDHDFYRLSPNLRQSRDRPALGSSPDLVNDSERGNDDKHRHRRRHAHAHDSPKRTRRHEEQYDRYSDFRDDYGLGRRY